jgi:hypothetical protein
MRTITGDQVEFVGTTERANEVRLTLDVIKDIHIIPDSLMVSENQPVGSLEIVKPPAGSSTWTIVLDAGRHKTSAVAQAFLELTGGTGRVFSPDRSSVAAPDELNFFFGVVLDIELGSQIYAITVYLGQGSYGTVISTNNWWIGGESIVHQSSTAVMGVVEPETLALTDLYTLGGGVYEFSFKPWLGQTRAYPSQADWLSAITGDPLICDINLPGTHDSAAINRVFVTPWSTQDCSLTTQLKYGVRALDMRLSIHEDGAGGFTFITCHGKITPNEYQSFESAMQECEDFLGEHKDEFIAMRLQVDDWNDVPESKQPEALLALRSVVQSYPVIVNSTTMPTLRGARGKMYLINCISIDPGLGVPIKWTDNTPNETLPPNALRSFTVQVQDQYEDLGGSPTSTKLQLFKDATARFVAGQLNINFGSAITSPVGIPFGVYIAGDVVRWLGETSGPSRSRLRGWSFFDYIASGFPTSVYGTLYVGQLIISSNFSYSDYSSPFKVNLNYDDRM